MQIASLKILLKVPGDSYCGHRILCMSQETKNFVIYAHVWISGGSSILFITWSSPHFKRPHYGLIAPKVLSNQESGERYSKDRDRFVLPPSYRDRFKYIDNNYGPIALILDINDYKSRLSISAGDSATSLQMAQKAFSQNDIKWENSKNWDEYFIPWKYRMLFARLMLSDFETLTPRSAPWLNESRDWYYKELIKPTRDS